MGPLTCDICGNEMRPNTQMNQHVRERSPFPTLCMGCFAAQTDLEMFLLRATMKCDGENAEGGRTVMGDWAAGWLREILKDPRRFL